MISYEYPPNEGVGGLRAYYFSKYLERSGWNVTVVTLNDNSQRNTAIWEDMFNGISEVYHSEEALSLRKFASRFKFFIPDVNIGWILPTFRLCDRIVRKKNIKVIYASCNPFSSAVIGVLIKKRFNIPLIVDFRDPWTLDWDVVYPTYFHEFLDNFLESRVLRYADHLVVATEYIKKEYIKKYSFIQDKISVITNGFEANDFQSQHLPLFEKFTITYCGSFSGRQPDLFLSGLKKAIMRKRLSPKTFQALFLGPKDKQLTQLIKHLDLSQYAIHIGYFQHKIAVEFMFRSHMLLLIEPRQGALTTKVFEYLATGKPILALVSKGELEELVRKYSDVSYVLTLRDPDEVAEAIYDCYNKWLHNGYRLTNSEKVKAFRKTYNRQALTEKLIVILDHLIPQKCESLNEAPYL